MVIVFDNCISPHATKAMACLERDHEIRHLTDHMPPDTKDEVWLPEFGKNGWICVSGDWRITKKPGQCALRRQYKVTSFFLRDGIMQMKTLDQMQCLCHAWSRVQKVLRRFNPGDCFRIKRTGDVERWDHERDWGDHRD